MARGPACQAFWTTTAVFDATVVAIEDLEVQFVLGDGVRRGRKLLVKLDVRQAWKGVRSGPLEVVTEPYDASCGFEFKVGRRYLIFSDDRPVEGRISVSHCSLTREFNPTDDAIKFLASLERPAAGGRAYGTVKMWQRSFGPPVSERPMDLPVTLTGAGRSITLKSTGGRYEFNALKPGQYEISFAVPEGYTSWRTSQPIEIPNDRACSEVNIGVSADGRITGRLIDAQGRGVPQVNVEVWGADSPMSQYGAPMSASSDPDGFFEIRPLPPGRYLIGINARDLPNDSNPYSRVIYPGDNAAPHVVELSLGLAADLGQWTLPAPLPVVRISGSIVWRDGRPAKGVYVTISDRTGGATHEFRGAGGATSGPDGTFGIDGRLGREYVLSARHPDGPRLQIRAPRILARPGLEPFRIVILSEPKK
jgi:hypothetical protein